MKIAVIENPRPLTPEHYNDVANAPLSASLNSGYALAVSRAVGWDTVYLDFTSCSQSPEYIAETILLEDADIVLFHWVYSWGHEDAVLTVLDMVRKESDALLGAFGLFPTLSRNHLMLFAPKLDFVLAGEFEDSLTELLQLFEEKRTIAGLPGVVLRDEKFVPRPLIRDLSLLPVPDDVGSNCLYPGLNIAASRGCYGECSFCFIHRYYGCSHRRGRDAASILRELEIRLSRREISSLYFIDPLFIGKGAAERERVVEISRMVRQLGLPFGFETRVDTVDEEILATLASNGATSVFLGIESGCDAVLERLGKRINTEQIRRAIGNVRRSGMELNLGFIMFEPDSTLPELEESFSFLEELGLLAEHAVTANLLYHNQIVLYGSVAWERLEREGRLLDRQLPFEARYRFRDERVGLVCSSMGRITSGYFSAMESVRHQQPVSDFRGRELNALLKDAFRSLCSASCTLSAPHVDEVELEFVSRIARFCNSRHDAVCV